MVLLLSAEKDDALFWAAVWTDDNYYHEYVDSDVPDELLRANAILATVYLAGNLYANYEGLSSKTVTAGSVTVAKTYTYIQQRDIRLKRVRQLLDYVATRIDSANLTRV